MASVVERLNQALATIRKCRTVAELEQVRERCEPLASETWWHEWLGEMDAGVTLAAAIGEKRSEVEA